MSSSRVRFSLHISAHRGEERRKGGRGSQESKEMHGRGRGEEESEGGGQENDGRGRQGAGRLRDEMFSRPCCLFLEQTAALKATAARCHCYEHTASENGTADLKPASHSEIQG